MPNGNLGNGLGTQASPFELWDVLDLDALRGKPNSIDNRIFIRFKADIDFRNSPFADLFTTIRFGNNLVSTSAWDFVDIDGEGHSLRNFRQIGASVDCCGLFRYVDGNIRNLNIHCKSHYAFGSVQTGILAQFARSALIENINIIGSALIEANTVSGLIGSLQQINNTTPTIVTNCTVNLRVATSNTTSVSFFGFCQFMTTGAGHTVVFHKCVSANNIYCGTSGVNAGGFVGALSSNGNVTFDSCISECDFVSLTPVGQFTGIVAGYRAATGAMSTQNYINCISKCSFDGMPPATVNNLAAFGPNTSWVTVTRSYAACKYDLRTSTANIRGGDGIFLFDWENSGLPLSRFTDGTVNGLTTAQLKSKEFMQSRGWMF